MAFVRGIHQWPMNSPHKGPVTRKMFSFDDVIMETKYTYTWIIDLINRVQKVLSIESSGMELEYWQRFCGQ